MSRKHLRGCVASSTTRALFVRAIAPLCEPLEQRTLLAVSLTGFPNWVDQGSKPMINTGFTSDPNNPASGAVEDIAIDPNNPAHIYVGTVNGGIWRTTNGNRPFNGIDDDGINGVDDALEQPTWVPLTDSFPSLAIADIKFSPLDPTGNTIFAGTGSSSSLGRFGGNAIGVFRTTDDGNTWTVTRLNPGGGEPQVRAMLPTTFDADPVTAGVQQVILVGTVPNQGMYRSTDGGQTYTQLTQGTNGIPTGGVTSIIADPNNASRFFAGVAGNGVYRSDNGGVNWTQVNTNLTQLAGSTVIQLTAHPGGGTTVLHALVSGPSPVAFTSNDGGGNWTGLAAIPAGFTSGNNGLYTRMASDQMAVDPTNSQIVYISKGYGGSPFMYRYNPAGAGSWVQIESGGAAGNTLPHVDHRDLEFVGTNVLVSANDGGIYFIRNPQNAAANRWTSLHGRGNTGLGATEYTNVAWDSVFDVITGGSQDNGTTVQTGAGNAVWSTYAGNDGGDVAVDTVNAGAGRVFRYSSSQNFGWLRRHTFDSATNQPVAAVDLFPAGGLANFTPYFVPPFELNSVTPARMVVGGGGTSPVYELTNAATAPNAAGATWVAVPVGAGFTTVNQNNGAPFAAGGRTGGVDNAEVLVVGSGARVFVRSTAGGTLTATATPFPGGTVQDLVLDPNDWRHILVTDGTRVYETTDAGAANWTELTLDNPTGNTRIQSIEFVPTAAGGVVLVGGNLGVSRLSLSGPDTAWTRYGLGLANALVSDMEYNAADDVLVAGTFGRGAWTIPNASTSIDVDGCLIVNGDTDFANQDDNIRLVRDANNPLLLNVFLNNNTAVPNLQVPLAALSCIEINGLGGQDTITIDGTNGQIGVANEFLINGNTGNDIIDAAGATGDNVTINGNAGNDLLTGGDGDDEINGGADNDTLIGNAGGDNLIGGSGSDTADYSLVSSDLVITTFDNLFNDGQFSEGDNVQDDVETVLGGSGHDSITGADVANLLVGNNGDDTLNGLGGDDTLNGNSGDDEIHGGDDDDLIAGGDDNDLLFGDAGNDSMLGGSGGDTMQGGDDNDTMHGNDGDDSMQGNDGDDSMLGGADSDTMEGNAGNDIMQGNDGRDIMFGNADNDTMHGNDGDDYLEGNGGDDSMLGGAGEDDLIGGSSTVGAADGADHIEGGDDADVIAGDNAQILRNEILPGIWERYTPGIPAGTGLGLENNAVIRTVTLLNLDVIGAGDFLQGDGGDDTMFGQLGDDFMTGNDGHDDIIGHLGSDTMDGGEGDDGILGDKGTIVPDLLDDSATEVIKTNDKKITTTINVAGTRKRFVTLESPSVGGHDLIICGNGNDSAHGGAGNDTISGNDGNDALFGNDGDDSINGDAGNDHLFGGADDDFLDGGLDADIIYGGDGQDSLTADNGADRLVDWSGNFNTFFVPGPSYGAKIIIRSPNPQVQSFLMDLAAGDGATDPALEIAVVKPGSKGNHGKGEKGK